MSQLFHFNSIMLLFVTQTDVRSFSDHYFHPDINIETKAHHDTLQPACITFSLTFSGSTVIPMGDYITGWTTLYGTLLTFCPWVSILLSIIAKVRPAISCCLRGERGLRTSQLGPAISLEQRIPCCPTGDKYMKVITECCHPSSVCFQADW